MRLRNVAFLFKIEVDISSTVHTFVSLVEAGGCKYHMRLQKKTQRL